MANRSNKRVTPEQLNAIDKWDRQTLELGMAKQFAAKLGISQSVLSLARKRLRARRARQPLK